VAVGGALGRARRLIAGLGAFGALVVVGVLWATAIPAGAQNTATSSGLAINGTFNSSVPVYRYGIEVPSYLQSNEAGLTCPGSTTAPNGGPAGNALECVFTTPVMSGMFTLNGTMPWPSGLMITPFASSNNSTYVTGAPILVTGASTSTTTPSTPTAPAPTSEQPTTPAAASTPSIGSSTDNWIWWVLVAGGVALVVGTGGFVEPRRLVGLEGTGGPDAGESPPPPPPPVTPPTALASTTASDVGDPCAKERAEVTRATAQLQELVEQLDTVTAASSSDLGGNTIAFYNELAEARSWLEDCKQRLELCEHSDEVPIAGDSGAPGDDLM
jgi:hypothetical protein